MKEKGVEHNSQKREKRGKRTVGTPTNRHFLEEQRTNDNIFITYEYLRVLLSHTLIRFCRRR